MVKHTVQGILQQHLPSFLRRNKVPLHHYKALKQLSECRTATLGGHTQVCENGHVNGVWYNSCKNRFCPQCRGMATEEWLINTQEVLLDCAHHHIIFTLPSELHDLWRYNQAAMTNILFRASLETLNTFAKDPQHLNAIPGIIATLHTWGRDIPLHPHLHTVVSHGGINKTGDWVTPKRKCLFPQKPIMEVYRGKLRAKILEAMKAPQWVLPPDRRDNQLRSLLNKLGRKDWVVHFCEPYEHANGVAKYLSRYVKSGPLKNSQLTHVTDTHVTFRYKSHTSKRIETLRLPIDAFIRRLIQHVPLPGKPTVRYSGLYHPAARKRLNTARHTFGQREVSARQLIRWQEYLEGKDDQPVCQDCGLALKHSTEIAPQRRRAA